MNSEKAREYFSSYREGALEGGLRQSFEQKLRSDRQLQAEYEAFNYAVDQLDSLKDEEIPIPLYLNSRIQGRLEEAHRPVAPAKGVVFYLPRFAFAACIAGALFFAAKNVLRPSAGNAIQAGAFSSSDEPAATTWPSESISVEARGSQVQVHYNSASDHSVEIFDGTGAKLREYQLKAEEPLKAELKNPNGSAAVFEVRVSDSGPDDFIAVPGTSPSAPSTDTAEGASQSGNVIDFAKALATHYGKAVIYTGKNSSVPLNWNLSQSTEKGAADEVFKGTQLEGSVTMTNLLTISDK